MPRTPEEYRNILDRADSVLDEIYDRDDLDSQDFEVLETALEAYRELLGAS